MLIRKYILFLSALLLMADGAMARSTTTVPFPTPLPPLSTLSVSDTVFDEGNTSISYPHFTLKLTNALPNDLVVHYQTGTTLFGALSSNTCQGGTDFLEGRGDVVIAAGSKVAFIPIGICGDTNLEFDEDMQIMISLVGNTAPGVIMSASTAVGYIANDDQEAVSGGGNHGGIATTCPPGQTDFGDLGCGYQN